MAARPIVKWLQRSAVALLGTVVAILSLSAPAFAASSGGAQVFNGSFCERLGDGTTFCATQHEVITFTTTPSGNLSIVRDGRVDATVSPPDGPFSEFDRFHLHALIQKGQLQERSQWTFVFSVSDSLTCTDTMDFHFANGQVQFDNFTIDCTP